MIVTEAHDIKLITKALCKVMVISGHINESYNTAGVKDVKNYISFTLQNIIKSRIKAYVILTLKLCSFYSTMFGLISAMLWGDIAFTTVTIIIIITIITGVLTKLEKVIMTFMKTMW